MLPRDAFHRAGSRIHSEPPCGCRRTNMSGLDWCLQKEMKIDFARGILPRWCLPKALMMPASKRSGVAGAIRNPRRRRAT